MWLFGFKLLIMLPQANSPHLNIATISQFNQVDSHVFASAVPFPLLSQSLLNIFDPKPSLWVFLFLICQPFQTVLLAHNTTS